MAAKNSLKVYSPNSYYHIYNRGVEKRPIFKNEQDYAVFMSYLKNYLTPKNEDELRKKLCNPNLNYKEREKILKELRLNNFYEEITLIAYCLMKNHFHFLIKQKSANSIDKFMNSLGIRYTMYFNRKYKRAGPLFQDRFKANHIQGDEHLLNISFYVNLNKVLEKLQHFDKSLVVSKNDVEKLLEGAERDPWSSYPVYLGLRDDHITQDKFILSLLSDDIKKARQEYRKLAKDFIVSGHFLKTRDLVFE